MAREFWQDELMFLFKNQNIDSDRNGNNEKRCKKSTKIKSVVQENASNAVTEIGENSTKW